MNKLKEIRKAKGRTLKHVAEAAGTSIQQVQRLENSERRLTTEWIERLASALDCSPSDIVPSLRDGSLDEWNQKQMAFLKELEEKDRAAFEHAMKLTYPDRYKGGKE